MGAVVPRGPLGYAPFPIVRGPERPPIVVTIWYGTEKKDWLEEARSRFAATNPTYGGRPIQIQLKATGDQDFHTIGTDTTAPYTTMLNTAGWPNGDAQLQVLVTDVAGSSRLSPVRSVTFDNTAPTVSLGSLAAAVSGTVTLTATASTGTTEVLSEQEWSQQVAQARR